MIKNLSVNVEANSIKKSSVHKLIRALKSELKFTVDSLVINFVNSDYIRKINLKYLNHSFSTDIITFNYSGSNSILDGEIFISCDDARLNANKYGVTLSEELTRLVIHGILHLAGYDDKSNHEKKIMKSIENRLTYKYNFALL